MLQHIAAFNARDQAAEPWADDARLIAPGAEVAGWAETLAVHAAFLDAFPDGRLEIVTQLTQGDRVAAEGRFCGTHDGPLVTPDSRPVQPTGAAVDFRWSSIYETAGAELLSEHYFYDRLEFAEQMGLL